MFLPQINPWFPFHFPQNNPYWWERIIEKCNIYQSTVRLKKGRSKCIENTIVNYLEIISCVTRSFWYTVSLGAFKSHPHTCAGTYLTHPFHLIPPKSSSWWLLQLTCTFIDWTEEFSSPKFLFNLHSQNPPPLRRGPPLPLHISFYFCIYIFTTLLTYMSQNLSF